MNSEQVKLVKESFAKVLPIADTAADLFYARLFELDPSLRRMFPTDMAEQKHKLMMTLKFAVNSLSRLAELVPAVQALGRRHAGYGVKNEHYNTVGAALIWTLEQGLGDAFTPEVRDAWVTAFGVLSRVMLAAAAESDPARAA